MTGIAAKLGQPRRRNGGAVPDDWCLFLPCLLVLLFLTAGSTSDFFHMTLLIKILHIIIHSKTTFLKNLDGPAGPDKSASSSVPT